MGYDRKRAFYYKKDFEKYMANPTWKEYYENALERAKAYINYKFGSFSTWN